MKRGANTSSPFSLVLDFSKRFFEKYNEPYVVSKGKHCALFKRLLSVYDYEKLSEFLDYYFDTRRTCKIEFFYTEIPTLIAELAEKKSKIAVENSQADKLEEARKKRGL